MRNLKIFIPYKSGNQIINIQTSYVNEGCTYFLNAQHLYLQLCANERCYFDFMCEKMDYRNRLNINSSFRKLFVDHYSKLTSSHSAPSEKELSGYEDKLQSLNLIIKPKGTRGIYYVNPKYVCRGKQRDRKNALKQLADKALTGEIDLTAILDRPIEKLVEESKRRPL